MMNDRQEFSRALSQLARQPDLDNGGGVPIDPALVAMGYLAHERGLPYFYAEELLKGMEMDLSPPRYKSLPELTVYCYHVAGVVGVMFSHLVGLGNDAARQQASELGIAMQLTNICRDILDDAVIGRIYLPQDLLAKHSVPFEPSALAMHREGLAAAALELLNEAESLYQSASAGFKHLPWRAALAASAARNLYRRIGREVRRRGPRAWQTRCRVTEAGKLWEVSKSLGSLVADIPYRIRHPWQGRSHQSQNLWRFISL
jgi:phytoene synthase